MKNKAKNKSKPSNGLQDDTKKKLTKSQKKKLQKVLDRRRKKANISDLLGELKKHQLTDEQYAQLTPRFGSKSKGFKQDRQSTESAAKIYSSGKKEHSQNESAISSTSFKVLDLELSSSEDEEDEPAPEQAKVEPEEVEQASEEVDMKTFKRKKAKTRVEQPPEPQPAKQPTEQPKLIDSQFVYVDRTQEVTNARRKLPIIEHESELIEMIKSNPVVIVHGETGSGKTTQLPQFLYEHGLAFDKQIVVTQPRRVAAISMSKRVAHEMNLGEDVVSFQIRHEGNVTERTRIKFVTDGVLMKELQKDLLLSNYSIVIIDEAHERSIYSDILIGLISRIIKLRKQRDDFFRLVIMSATLRLSDFIANERLFKVSPPVVDIPTRQHKIDVHFMKTTPDDYLKEAYKRICKIHREQPPNGGILVFVSGRKEVIHLVNKLRQTFSNSKQVSNKSDKRKAQAVKTMTSADGGKSAPTTLKLKDLMPEIDLDHLGTNPNNKSFHEELSDLSDDPSDDDEDANEFEIERSNRKEDPLYCLPLYSMLPEKEQSRVFEPPPEGSRLCVVATNVAETSLTIPNIKYVVDTGKVKNKLYDKTTGIYTHLVEWCAKSSADQRKGRSGMLLLFNAQRSLTSSLVA